LIALVVTIVVLIILAGVSIHLVLGENGILEKAKTARETTDYAMAKEKIDLKIIEVQTKVYSEKEENATLQELRDALQEDEEIEYVESSSQIPGAEESLSNSLYTKLKAYQYEFEIGENLAILSIKEWQEEVPNVAYEGLGYQFIYDGTLKDAGVNGKNMCKDVTGGWTSNRIEYTFNGVSGYYMGDITTNNKIDLSAYSKLCVSCNNVSVGTGKYNAIFGKREQFPDAYSLWQIETDEFEYSNFNSGKNLDLINIPKNFNNYILVYSAHSVSSSYYFDYTNSYMRNYTNADRYIDVYNIVALKEDDWKTWAKLAKIDVNKEENNTLEKILNNVEVLQQLFENENANHYLLKCSGTLMIEILKNDNSYNNIPDVLKDKMKNNENWNKFFTVCERSV